MSHDIHTSAEGAELAGFSVAGDIVTKRRRSEGLPPHVVVVPVPGQGHLNQPISIARYLAASGICVTLGLAARAYSLLGLSAASSDVATKVRSGGGADDLLHTPNLRVALLPDGSPPACDAKTHFSLSDMAAIFSNMRTSLQELLSRLMQQPNPPCCLIHDPILVWSPDLALLFGLPRIAIWTCSVSFLSIGIHLPHLLARGYLPAPDQGSRERSIDFIPGLSSFCIADLPPVFLHKEGLEGPHFQFLKMSFEISKEAERVLVNSMYELESGVVDHLRQEVGVRVDPVGPLFLSQNAVSASLIPEDSHCLAWLEKQAEASVLYVSFGSVADIDAQVYTEVAYGLEASGEAFLWVIRPDAYNRRAKGEKAIITVEEFLPEGFVERTKGRGLVIEWAPQVAVLGHRAVGAFMTHCGWNSVMESLSKGVPMLGFPQLVDEWVNLRLIVRQWKVGLALPVLSQAPAAGLAAAAATAVDRNIDFEALASPCSIHRSQVQASVTAIIRGDQGAKARQSARAWRDSIVRQVSSGASTSCLQQLVDDLLSGSY